MQIYTIFMNFVKCEIVYPRFRTDQFQNVCYYMII